MPIKSIEEFRSSVAGLENAEDLMEFFVSQVEVEKSRGISEKQKVNREASNLRRFKLALEKLGYSDETDLESFTQAMAEAKEAGQAVKESGLKSTEVSELTKQLQKLQRDFATTKTQLDEERRSAVELKTKADRNQIKAKLIDALKEKVYGHDLLADSLINNGQVALEADEVVFINGEDRVGFEAGLKGLLDKRTDILKNTQRGGAGSTPATSDRKTFTPEQISSMSKEDVKANLADIKNALGIGK